MYVVWRIYVSPLWCCHFVNTKYQVLSISYCECIYYCQVLYYKMWFYSTLNEADQDCSCIFSHPTQTNHNHLTHMWIQLVLLHCIYFMVLQVQWGLDSTHIYVLAHLSHEWSVFFNVFVWNLISGHVLIFLLMWALVWLLEISKMCFLWQKRVHIKQGNLFLFTGFIWDILHN